MFLPHFLRVHLFFIVVFYAGWTSTPFKGGVIGTIFGIVHDYWLGIYLGLNGLSKALVGYSSAYLSQLVAAEVGSLRGVLMGVLSLVDQLLVIGLLLLLGEPWPQTEIYEIIVSSVLTGFVGEIFCRSYDKIRFPPADFRRL